MTQFFVMLTFLIEDENEAKVMSIIEHENMPH